MYSIEGTKITLTRGDTFRAQVNIMEGEAAYTPEAGDSIRFALKKSYSDAEPLILKSIPTDSLVLLIEPEDTKTLPFGNYVYDIELTKANGDVITFICKAKFKLTEEVH